MKILILMAYYNRPQVVRNAIESIKNQEYKDWELAFVDDGSDFPGKPIVEEILHEDLDKVKFFNTNHTRQQKEANGGSVFGSYWNKAMNESDADIAIMLCDDDALYPDSLQLLKEYYETNKNVLYSYGHVSIFNPYTTENFKSLLNSDKNMESFLNKTATIYPSEQVDASQVSWRLPNVIKDRLTFPEIRTINLDAVFYKKLYNAYGGCVFNGIIVQYKGVHPDQLGMRETNPYETKEMHDRTI